MRVQPLWSIRRAKSKIGRRSRSNCPVLRDERIRTDHLEIHQGVTIISIGIWDASIFDKQDIVACAIVAFQDIAEHKLSEQLLADHNHSLEEQVAERTANLLRECKRVEQASFLAEGNRIARETHDPLAQAFTGILLHIETAIERLTKQPETVQAHLETPEKLACTGLTERRSVTALRPKLLEEGNLFNALKHLTTQMRSFTNTQITCEMIGTAYPFCEETQCFRRVKDDRQGFDVDQFIGHGRTSRANWR
jgi:signal transduction histidine kinase